MGQKERLNELQEKMNEIFDGMDGYYGQSIMDELINRIDTTIQDFNKDFKELIGQLGNPPANKSRTTKKSSTVSKTKSTRSKAKT